MKRRNKKKLMDIKFISDSIFLISGIIIILLFMLIFSAVMVNIGSSYKITVLLAQLSLCAGCFISSYGYAVFMQRNGMINGLVNSLKIYAVIFIAGLITIDDISAAMIPIRLICAALSGMLGGIYGVNSKIRKPI